MHVNRIVMDTWRHDACGLFRGLLSPPSDRIARGNKQTIRAEELEEELLVKRD